MPIYQKGTSTVTKVKDMYLCDAASSFTRICKVYLCTGANTFVLVYDGCGFACDGYFNGGTCGSNPIENYYGDGNAGSSYAISDGTTYVNSSGGSNNFWNLTTYQCSTCPPPGNIIVEYQTCPESTGSISPYLFLNRGLSLLKDVINYTIPTCVGGGSTTSLSSFPNMIVSSVNSFMPLVNNRTTGVFGNDPGVCTCVTDTSDWKVPSTIKYITTPTQSTPEIDITVNNNTFSTPSGLNCNSTTGFRENLNSSNANLANTFSKYGIFWGADNINTDGSCPINCYGTSGGNSSSPNPSGYACKSVAKIPIILREKGNNSSSYNYSTDIKYNNGTTVQEDFIFYRLFNLGFAVKINSGSPKWKIKITYPVYFSERELKDFYGITVSGILGSSYELTNLFNTINHTNTANESVVNNNRTYFDLMMMKPVTSMCLDFYNTGSSQINLALLRFLWNRNVNLTNNYNPTYAINDETGEVASGNIRSLEDKPIYCLSIEIQGDGNEICSAALFSGSESSRKIKLEPMTKSSGTLYDQYQMFTLSANTNRDEMFINQTLSQEVSTFSNVCSTISGVASAEEGNYLFTDVSGSPQAVYSSGSFFYYPIISDYINNYWTYTKQITQSSITIQGTGTGCSGEQT